VQTYGVEQEDGDILVPDGLLSMKFSTHTGDPGVSASLTILVQQIVTLMKQLLYLDTEGDPLWFSIGKDDRDLVPTGMSYSHLVRARSQSAAIPSIHPVEATDPTSFYLDAGGRHTRPHRRRRSHDPRRYRSCSSFVLHILTDGQWSSVPLRCLQMRSWPYRSIPEMRVDRLWQWDEWRLTLTRSPTMTRSRAARLSCYIHGRITSG